MRFCVFGVHVRLHSRAGWFDDAPGSRKFSVCSSRVCVCVSVYCSLFFRYVARRAKE